MSNDENNAVTNAENSGNNKDNMTVDAFGNYVNAESTQKNVGDKKGPDKKLIMIIGGVVAALAVVIILLNLLGGGGARGVAEKYAKAYKNLDAKAIVNLLPKDVVDKSNTDDFDLEGTLKEQFDTLKELEISIESVSVNSDEKVLTKEEIEDNSSSLEYYGIDVKDVSEAIVFTIKLTAKNKDGDTKDGEEKVTVLKYKGSWELLPFDIS